MLTNSRYTEKQFIKAKSWSIAHEIHCGLLDEANAPTMLQTKQGFPRTSYYKHADTGVIRLGLSFKGIRNLVKKFNFITTQEVKQVFNIA